MEKQEKLFDLFSMAPHIWSSEKLMEIIEVTFSTDLYETLYKFDLCWRQFELEQDRYIVIALEILKT